MAIVLIWSCCCGPVWPSLSWRTMAFACNYVCPNIPALKNMLLFSSLIFHEGRIYGETEVFQGFLLPEMMDIWSGTNQ